MPAPSSSSPVVDRWALAIVVAWTAIYTWRTVVGHYGLTTSAFDLSVFDYAIWSLKQGGPGYVPFIGHSIFAHHFMPILVLFVPLYAVVESPTLLLIVQVVATAAAGLLFFVVAGRLGVERLAALLLLVVFLLSRRTHGAVAGSFYPESLQALLTFGIVLTWTGRLWLYWLSVILLLATKEDAAIYVATFGATMWLVSTDRRRSVLTFAVASAWFIVALLVAIPASRAAEGLSRENPLLAGRYGSSSGAVAGTVLADRLADWTTIEHAAQLMATTGGLSFAGPVWLLPAVPGIVLNLVADPESMQASLTGHYVWPVLPWLFIAAAAGIVRIARWSRRAALALVSVLAAVVLADNPALQRLHTTQVTPEARAARQALRSVLLPADAVVVAQGNLIPHLPRSSRMFAAGDAGVQPPVRPTLVLLTDVGNHWPMTRDQVHAEIERYRQDPAYELVGAGPVHIFAQRTR